MVMSIVAFCWLLSRFEVGSSSVCSEIGCGFRSSANGWLGILY